MDNNHKPHVSDNQASAWPTLEALRLDYLRRAIAHMNGNKTRAAKLLGIDRRTVNRILARHV
jgi:transcriptional regulator of acetoin/glycerol metabolism